MAEPRIPSRTVESLQFGSSGRVYSPEHRYLRADGFDRVVKEVCPELNRSGLLKHLRKLRYPPTAAEGRGDADEAAKSLAAEASLFLPEVAVEAGRLSQLDGVTRFNSKPMRS